MSDQEVNPLSASMSGFIPENNEAPEAPTENPPAAEPAENPEAIPELFAGLLGAFGIQDADGMGRRIGGMMANMRRRIEEPPPPGVNQVAHMFEGFFGPEEAARLAREVEVKDFFRARLAESSMPEAIRLTKERFELPDDYSIEIPLRVVFKLPTAEKTGEPDVD